MLRYASKLTATPGAMTRDDVDALRAAGLSDADVLGLVEVTAYYAYANRIADGLGIAVEPDRPPHPDDPHPDDPPGGVPQGDGAPTEG